MSTKQNISWWANRVPRLENWLPGKHRQLDAASVRELEDFAENSDFHKELSPFVTDQNILVINKIAEDTMIRIDQRYGNIGGRPLYWILAGGFIIGLLISLSIPWNKNDNSGPQANSTALAQADTELIAEKQDSEDNHHFDNIVDPGVKKSGSDGADKAGNNGEPAGVEYMADMYRSPATDAYVDYGEVKASDDVEAKTNIGTQKPPDGTIPFKEPETNKTDKTDKHNPGGQPSGIKFTGGGHSTAPTRDPAKKMVLQDVTIGLRENYWRYINSTGRKTGTQNGQLGSDGSDFKPREDIHFSLEDMPSYKGGDDKMMEDLKYHVRKHALKKSYNEPVSVSVSFVINAKGVMEDINILYASTSEIKSAVRDGLKDLEPWKKGKKSGKKGSLFYELALSFN